MTSPWQPPEPTQPTPPPVYQQPMYQQPVYQQPVYQPVPVQQNKSKTWVWVTVIVSVVVVLLAVCAVAAWLGLAKLNERSRTPYPLEPYPESSPPVSSPRVAVHQIKIYVTGKGTAKLNWATSGSLYDNKTTTLPWSTTGATRQDFVRSSVSVSGKGKMECRIEIDGQIRAEESGNGSVTCFFEGYL